MNRSLALLCLLLHNNLAAIDDVDAVGGSAGDALAHEVVDGGRG